MKRLCTVEYTTASNTISKKKKKKRCRWQCATSILLTEKNQKGEIKQHGAAGRRRAESATRFKASWLGWEWGWAWGWRHPIGCSRWVSQAVCCWHRLGLRYSPAASSACPAGSQGGVARASSGGRFAWSVCRRVGSQISFHLCGCGSGGPAHRSEQTFCCSRASCTGRVVLL